MTAMTITISVDGWTIGIISHDGSIHPRESAIEATIRKLVGR